MATPYGARIPRNFSVEALREMYRIGKNRTVGNIYYVDAFNGNAANDGLSPSSPLLTIAAALALCVSGGDDYIIVMNCYQQETFPISITKDCVHILGVAGPEGSWQMMDPPTDTAIFSLAIGAENCEIAYFSLGGIAQGTHGAIELLSGNNQTHIHHCTFGHWWTGGGQDGIRFAGGSHFSVVIEDCWFYGVSAINGKLSRYGIYSIGTGSIGQCTIRNNKFIMLPTTAICLQGNAIHEVIVDNNIIACRADAVATAIDLGLNALGCLITRNRAGYGAANMVQNPYLDQAPAGSNHWSDNMQGNQYAYGA